MADFVMPSLGADMEAGTLVAWHKQPGETVHRGDLIAEVETDKGIIEVEVFTTGIVEKILVPVGEKVPVGTILATIREDVTVTPTIASKPAPSIPVTQPAVNPVTAPAATKLSGPVSDRLPMSPSARRLARELGVDPATIKGTGRGGAVTREDIELAARNKSITSVPVPPAVPASGSAVPPASVTAGAVIDRSARMRQTIAAAMTRSKREIPHYYLSTTIDLHAALTWLTAENEKRSMSDRLLPGVLLLKAVALALREVPELNALWSGDSAVPSPSIHVGVAISLRQGGLIAPALHNTDQQPIDELMKNFRDLVNRARSGGLRSSELADPTITVTSLGDQGVDSVFGIIYPPQVAIVGFGRVVERPWSVQGEILSRPVTTATLSADHRVTDGHRGGQFLAAVDRLLQQPEKL